MYAEEKSRLEHIANNSLYDKGANAATIHYEFEVFRRFVLPGSILEMGPAEGLMTGHLVDLGQEVVCVDGSEFFSERLKEKYPSVEVITSLFEDFETDRKFDNIVLGHVLEHVDDPVQILKVAKKFLAPNGILFAAVPNARSLHRQAGVIMGLLQAEDELNELDKHHGHRRVFNPESFRQAFYQSGYNIDYFGGYWMKPVANSQIEANWTPEMLEAFMKLGERYPDIAGEIYVVASNK
ncbi:class I SAM-dependent methyltransferase [Thalassospira sp.]|uniref:class I SAM-dependent methyltransferase n=1 Tax=Thalassospira sp. TaxID=1912094 RepID=UPI000C60DE12|nr:class I SAM-dependent methyltransferase [Thalassospira sp.]MAL41482.1 methyltransferase type 12 [Thalassospira sp.]RCK27270.1 methyltransferase type 12 [Thalassospira profundimaris]|tara:strand:+ start:2337 stop:3050 length:714 start_codon:yes stop_codon:yes gene_type:complete